MPHFVYLLPVHNEALVLEANTVRLAEHLARFEHATILLVENGSADASFAICERLTGQRGCVRVLAFREPAAGMGYAYDRGLREALAAHGPDPNVWVVLTAADLPFGFTDLEQVVAALEGERETDRPARMLIGSKAHHESRAGTGFKRRSMSAAYRVARWALVGMRVGDSQGSVFVRLDLAAGLVDRVEARGFFYSTELCFFAERAGERIREVPVVLESQTRPSTVRAWKHGTEMARQLWELRRR
jgi:dolichyl-phosphate beta-glucosyltransferase